MYTLQRNSFLNNILFVFINVYINFFITLKIKKKKFCALIFKLINN